MSIELQESVGQKVKEKAEVAQQAAQEAQRAANRANEKRQDFQDYVELVLKFNDAEDVNPSEVTPTEREDGTVVIQLPEDESNQPDS